MVASRRGIVLERRVSVVERTAVMERLVRRRVH
jgi:hypothetical protein